MDASAVSPPPRSQEKPPEHGGDLREAPAEEIAGEAGDDFLFAEDTFPSLPDFPCLSSPSSSTFSSSSSSNSSSAYTNAAGGAGGGGADAAGERSEPASAGEGFDALDDIDQLLDFASLSMPWDSEPPFPEASMMLEDAMFAPPRPVGDGRRDGKAVLEGTGGEEACMDAVAAAGEELPRFFMEWLTSNRENISAEDLRSIRLRRSTIEAADARLGGGRQGTMQLLKLILTWVQNHHLQRKRPRDAMDEAAGLHGHGHSQLSSPGANPGYEFPAGGQDMAAGGGTSWMPYQQPFTPPAYGGDAVYPSAAGQYPFHQSSSTSSVVVSSQPFSPPAVGDMHAAGGGNMAWPQQYVPFPGASTGSYPMPPVVPQPFSPGFGGQYAGAGHPMGPQRVAGVEASATKEARKKRMARQRRLSCLQQQRSQQLNLGQIQVSVHPQEPSPRSTHSAPVTPSAGGWGFWSAGSQQQVQNPLSKSNSSRAPMQHVPRSPDPEALAAPPAKPAPGGARQEESPQSSTASDKRQGVKADTNLRFLLQKVLKQSDVGSLGRIVLPKKEAEVHLPELQTRDGISIPMEDIGTSRVWNMRYRFWPNNKSRMYLLENTGDFVRSNELQEGDFIVIYSDVKSGKYLIRGVKVRPVQEQGNGSSAAGKHKHGYPGPVKAVGASDDGGAEGTSKPDGACKGRSPQGMRPACHQGAASMALSI
ncbi:Regulatory protein viviparous-1 [Dichanthelium oligosanthes]|uniref:Regulatory protein viviparous-1 n=1 Tax=Dichanthelium oligosanthes TaxID=888268 RepID=A0A1E5VVA1_9POAL|nr:Regulatory protein viviparous-1 [Dichanthelium oligosanthes]